MTLSFFLLLHSFSGGVFSEGEPFLSVYVSFQESVSCGGAGSVLERMTSSFPEYFREEGREGDMNGKKVLIFSEEEGVAEEVKDGVMRMMWVRRNDPRGFSIPEVIPLPSSIPGEAEEEKTERFSLLSRGRDFLQSKNSSSSDAIAEMGDFRKTEYVCRGRKDPPPVLKGKTSVVVACRNRNSTEMRRSLLSSLPNKRSQVILVDWGSDEKEEEEEGIQVERVGGVSNWNLPLAYNFGMERARGEFLLKIDCDTKVASFPSSPPPEGTFLTGDWRKTGNEHSNGVFYARREDVRKVGFFDERMRSYGWDDSDLFSRLEKAGLRRKYFEKGSILHANHPDSQREGSLPGKEGFSLYLSMHRNRVCSEEDKWSSSKERATFLFDEEKREHFLSPDWTFPPFRSCNEGKAVFSAFERLVRGCEACVSSFRKEVPSSLSEEEMVSFLSRKMGDASEKKLSSCVSEWDTFRLDSIPSCRNATLLLVSSFRGRLS